MALLLNVIIELAKIMPFYEGCPKVLDGKPSPMHHQKWKLV
ncbi:hypothetical protein ADICYQ_4094 [Cyclobacterium qasimii M12-11B]|nr:hypothetical protein ADICYQ_4094 [Cyclobacterium qasimii M12-11B]